MEENKNVNVIEDNNVVEENVVKEVKKEKKVFYIIFKILFLAIYCITTAILLSGYFEVLATTESQSLSLGLYLALIVIIMGGTGYCASLIVAIIGLIVSIVKKAKKSNLIFFIIAVLLPIITEATFIIMCQILANSIPA